MIPRRGRPGRDLDASAPPDTRARQPLWLMRERTPAALPRRPFPGPVARSRPAVLLVSEGKIIVAGAEQRLIAEVDLFLLRRPASLPLSVLASMMSSRARTSVAYLFCPSWPSHSRYSIRPST